MTTSTLALTDFLLARIFEESHLAQSVLDADSAAHIVADLPHPHFRHVVTWGPIRVLAECEAKRRIVVSHREVEWGGLVGSRCIECRDQPWPCLTLRALTPPYADHPDYREEWRV